MTTTIFDFTERDAAQLVEALRPFARTGEPTPVTTAMTVVLASTLKTTDASRMGSAFDHLTMVGYIYNEGGEAWFDPQGMRGERRYPPLKLEQPRAPTPTPSPAPQAPSRPSWDETGMQLAQVFAQRSVDQKFKVGAVILSNESHAVVSGGLNGRYPGAPTEERASLDTGCSEQLHAEQNAIVRARWEHGEKHTLFTTLEPCHECALLILAARHINRVVFGQAYAGDGKRRRGAEILAEAGVEVVQWRA